MPRGSTSTKRSSPELERALAGVPDPFRLRLIDKYLGLRDAFVAGAFDAVGLRSGIFAETALRLLQQLLTGTHIPFGTPVGSFEDECAKLQRLPKASGHESLRLVLPRALSFVYTIRNKRGIGHAGGDVEANGIDASTSVRVADWCLCELIRLFHGLSLEEAQALIDAIATREIPAVWAVGGRKRVLDTSLDYQTQVLLLLYASTDSAVLAEDLQDWVEYPDASKFRTRVLAPLHRERLVEWDKENAALVLSPKGGREIENRLQQAADRVTR
jgi:hypothetical protein